MKIYGFFNSIEPYPAGIGAPAIAISEKGDIVAFHFCTNESFARMDLGMAEMRDWSNKQELYEKYAPDGYELEFVSCDSLDGHMGLNKALGMSDEHDNN